MMTNTASTIVWEDRLTRLSLVLLLGATLYGTIVGAFISMYYDLTPNMDTVEDNLGQIQAILYLLPVLISFAHLPLALSDIKRNFWKQAIIRLITFISPLIIMLGTDGLISHFIGWQPISDTDRFHMLHHTVFVGLPLTLCYWLGLHVWWQPATFNVDSSLSRRSWLTSGVILIWFVMLIGILSGIISPIIFGSTVVIGLLAVPIIWKFAV